MALFKIDGQKLTTIADAIRAYTGSEATMTPDAMAVKVESVHAAGYTSGWDQGLQDGQALGRQEGYASGKADGIEEGYTSGKDEGYTQGHVEGYNTGYENGNKEGYQTGYRDGSFESYDTGKAEGIEQGKQAEYDRFWDAFHKGLKSNGHGYAFTGGGWTDATYNPTQPIVATGACNYMYAMNWITSTKVPITIDTDNQYCTHIFYTCYGLKTIPYLKVTEKVKTFNYWFYWCPELEDVNFTEDSVIGSSIALAKSSKLTNASVQTIINALKDLTDATAQTLTLHADVGAKLTDEQKATITAKNWTLVY